MAPGILQISKQFMRTPAVILVKNEELTLDGIKQYFIAIEKEELKFPTLKELYKNLNIAQAIIYLNKKERVQDLQKKCEEEHIITAQMVRRSLEFSGGGGTLWINFGLENCPR